MHTTEMDLRDGRVRRRTHEPAFKAAVIAECSRPGVSIAAVALHHRLNANLLRRWVAQAGFAEVGHAPRRSPASQVESSEPVSGFVPVRIEPSSSVRTTIDVEVRRGATVVKVSWPMASASECGVWLRELLR